MVQNIINFWPIETENIYIIIGQTHLRTFLRKVYPILKFEYKKMKQKDNYCFHNEYNVTYNILENV